MPTQAQLANIYIGQQPPKAPGSNTRWISQSHQHMRIPMGPADRRQLFGSQGGTSGGLAAQEFNIWWNPLMSRYEATMNISQAQWFAYAPSPIGPWTTPVKVLGTGSGGEAAEAQQCTSYVEGNFVYLLYRTAAAGTVYKMVRSPLPTAASPNLSFTALGTLITATVGVPSGIGSNRLIKHPVTGKYYLFVESQGQGTSMWLSDGAQTPEDLISTSPLTLRVQQFTNGFKLNKGPRSLKSFGRIWPIVEDDGTWIIYGHSTSPLVGRGGAVERWISKDTGDIPANWTLDIQTPFLERQTALEIDQIADFQALKGANDKWFAFWTGLNNNGFNPTNIFCAAMIEPIMGFDGAEWTPTMLQSQPLVETGYVATDMIGGSEYSAANSREKVWNDQSTNAGGAYRLWPAAQGGRCKISNAAQSGTNPLKVRTLNGTDRIHGGNPITAASSATNTVTITTRKKHLLETGDFVTVTGFSPAGYNVNSAAITKVDDYNFTYTGTAGSSAATTVGVFESALYPGETRVYECFVEGVWHRSA